MEKRKYQRANLDAKAYINYNGLRYKVCLINMSLKGICLESEENIDIEVNNKIKVNLSIVNTMPEFDISFEGIVTRKEGCLIGFKIEIIDLDSFINLRNIVANNTGDYDHIMEEFYMAHN